MRTTPKHAIIPLAALTLIGSLASPASATTDNPEFHVKVTHQQKQELEKLGFDMEPVEVYKESSTYIATTPEHLNEGAAENLVESLSEESELNIEGQFTSTSAFSKEPLFAGQSWHYRGTGVTSAWDKG